MRPFALALLTLICDATRAQQLYFPPVMGNTWETVDPAALGWCTDAIQPLLDFVDANNSKAFIVLKDGRIAIEHYTGSFTQDSIWYWASAGKSLTSFLVGTAQADGLLDINYVSTDYLGAGWTSCTPGQESNITVRHQLTMTTGLDDGVANPDCTDPACLQFLAVPGTRWAYHNAPYTRLDGVIEGATGQTLNGYVYSKLTTATGIAGLYIQTGDNNVFYSKPRSMARFGLLALNRGVWSGNDILGDDAYFEAMTTPSQSLNESYGYLWWLNGQPSFMAPGSQFVFTGQLAPNAPADMFSALGKNGQQINVVPSQGIVVVRMGNAPGGVGAAVAIVFNNDLWGLLNDVFCTSTGIDSPAPDQVTISPVPANDLVRVSGDVRSTAQIIHADGRSQDVRIIDGTIDISAYSPGSYLLRVLDRTGQPHSLRLVVAR